ncbi:hypothetical protein TSUD_212420 [Trifolium subterraneum]|uniref:Orn/DAP/Arg decarboxylase 2 N-terminal domain-containing protein n=1 Tax=Trifolium subterraneum TaxID=3900 RepID=A0A2Z6N5A9_TRISU|nr:hypothetical protein TSUD_212420 [Trifolium subterraneum]
MPTLVVKESQITNLKLMFGASGVKGNELVTTLSSEATTFDIIQSIIKTKPTEIDSPFSVLDLRVVNDLMNKWTTNLPIVKPFYAVKCNPNISLLGVLVHSGPILTVQVLPKLNLFYRLAFHPTESSMHTRVNQSHTLNMLQVLVST